MRGQKYKKSSHLPNDSPFFIVLKVLPYIRRLLFWNALEHLLYQIDNLLENIHYIYQFYSYLCRQLTFNKPMSYLIKPKNYNPLLDLKQTELGIKQIKEFFQLNLSSELRLRRVTAPLFVLKGMGINDDLNGIERPVSFRSNHHWYPFLSIRKEGQSHV